MSPRFRVEESDNQEMSLGADTKSPNKSLFSNQTTGKEQSSKSENF